MNKDRPRSQLSAAGVIFLYFRTDLALELHDRYMKENAKKRAGAPDGIEYSRSVREGVPVVTVRVTDENGEKILGRPVGTYVTLDVSSAVRGGDRLSASLVLSRVLSSLGAGGRVLVACLGNARVTADAVGPCAGRRIIASHHVADSFTDTLGDVAVITPGVLSQTGIESLSFIKSAVKEVSPDTVIVIDALAAAGVSTLGVTVQVTDTGIRPGSGVGNDRGEISKAVLGVTTVAVGVPTVVDAASLLPDGCDERAAELRGMYVCRKDVDSSVLRTGRLIADAINKLCHPSLSFSDMEHIV